eukprot:CAMPEP_0184685604 /NCGR_PEP_ID=MMETSP0312-20130426/19497_1 /TAXON_ID=31354 /ORGANISM="Compsopogon coeruleus, Strain SAG 36.94" /LENGTH=70 /DNA_ID=CAMNT_0027139829 /DNA_START=81 /DNA_END=293 /DNA_ORIENTATION=-
MPAAIKGYHDQDGATSQIMTEEVDDFTPQAGRTPGMSSYVWKRSRLELPQPSWHLSKRLNNEKKRTNSAT